MCWMEECPNWNVFINLVWKSIFIIFICHHHATWENKLMMFPNWHYIWKTKVHTREMLQIVFQIKSLNTFHCSDVSNFYYSTIISWNNLMRVRHTNNLKYWGIVICQLHYVFLWFIDSLCIVVNDWSFSLRFWLLFTKISFQKWKLFLLFNDVSKLLNLVTDIRIPNNYLVIKSWWKEKNKVFIKRKSLNSHSMSFINSSFHSSDCVP